MSLLALVASAAGGCGSSNRAESEPGPHNDDPSSGILGGSIPSEPVRTRELVMFANTPDGLFRVDPSLNDPVPLGTFWMRDGTPPNITDIAIDRRGSMWGVGFYNVYKINPRTLEVTQLSEARTAALNALAIVSLGPTRESPDTLLAVDAVIGTVFEVDPDTGATKLVGRLGSGLASSGDLTW